MTIRIGMGYDAHRLVEGRPLILGGIEVPHHMGLLGHSDADVLVHALMDAILGALSAGSIGDFFPDTDDQYKGICSLDLLKKVRQFMESKHFQIINIDHVLVAQKPKLKLYIEPMREKIADTLAIDLDQVSIKATTTEALGFEGRQEGIAAHAVVLLQKS